MKVNALKHITIEVNCHCGATLMAPANIGNNVFPCPKCKWTHSFYITEFLAISPTTEGRGVEIK